MTLTAAQLSEASTLAVDYMYDKLPSILTTANYAFVKLTKKPCLKFIDGGDQIRVPIEYQENTAQGFVNGRTDVISTNPSQQFTHAELDWKHYYKDVPITLDDMTRVGSSKQAVVDFITAKMKSAESSMARYLGESLHGTGTAANKQWNGFTDIFAASGTAYAGINNTDVGNWLTEIDTSSQVPNYATINGMLGKLEEKNQASGQRNQFPIDFMLSRQRVIDAFKSSEQIKSRYYSEKDLEAGYKGVMVNGVKWLADAFTSGTAGSANNFVYFIAPESLKLCYRYGFEGKKSPFDSQQVLPNQAIQINVNYISGNLVCVNRRVNGVLKTISA